MARAAGDLRWRERLRVNETAAAALHAGLVGFFASATKGTRR
jgi:hypothetical protein